MAAEHGIRLPRKNLPEVFALKASSRFTADGPHNRPLRTISGLPLEPDRPLAS
jgi:hypothetical protein